MTAGPAPLARVPSVLLGITGSIASYKSVLLARLLLQKGARVQVVMTHSARKFVGEATFSGLTGQAVATDIFGGAGEPHVSLAASHDYLLVAPATADFLARAAQGRADDLLAALWLCFRGPKFVAPAMHPAMWEHPATERNVRQLLEDGAQFAGPVEGLVASGEIGMGRMLEPEQIVERVFGEQARNAADLRGKRILVTAGPTVEDLDPVRFLSNRSSGKMGFALAERAARRGATVDLVSGPVSLPTPPGVRRHNVRSAMDLLQTLRTLLTEPCNALLMAAAVGDYRAQDVKDQKMKRDGSLRLALAENPDVIATLAHELAATARPRPLLVAFALETGTDAEVLLAASEKRRKKGVDFVVANSASDSLGLDENRVSLVGPSETIAFPRLPKAEVAERLLDALFNGISPATKTGDDNE